MENKNLNQITPIGDDEARQTPTDFPVVEAPKDSFDPESLNSRPVVSDLPTPGLGVRLSAFTRSVFAFFKKFSAALVVLALLSVVGVLLFHSYNRNVGKVASQLAAQYDTQYVTLDGIVTDGENVDFDLETVTVNGALTIDGMLVVTPSLQPSAPSAGQLYYDQASDQLGYYNGSAFVFMGDQQAVETLGGAAGQVALGGGLAITGNQLFNSGVLSMGGQAGAIALGNGLTMSGNVLQNNGVLNVIAGANIAVSNDGNGNFTINNIGAGTGTVTSGGGTAGTVPLFTSAQNIEESAITQSGLTITITGDLSVVTGGLSLSNALTVGNGGTGATSLAANGVIVGNGTAALGSVAAGAPGLCLISTAGAPGWAACPGGGGGVTSLNSLTGALNVANASAAGSTITIDNATTGSKGIASFSGTNFSVSSGAVNTIQNINTGATPTFAGVNTNNINPSAALTVGATGQTLILQGDAGTVISATSGANTTTVGFNAPSADVAINFPALSVGSYDVCTTSGNCLGGGGGGANTALSNLASVAINTTLLPGSAGAINLGSATLPFGDIFLAGTSGTPGTNNFRITGASTSGTRTITLPNDSGTVCLSTGNCAGAGGGVTTLGGTIGTLPVFTGAQVVGDSLLSQSGGTVTVNGHLSLTAGNQFQINGSQISSANLNNDANLAKLSVSQTFTGNTNAFQNAVNSTNAFNIQNAGSSRILTVDTSNGEVELGLSSTLDGKLVFNNVSNANTVTVVPGTPTGNRTITLPDDSGIVCLNSGNCAGAGATLQTAYNFSAGGTTPKIKVDATRLGVDIQDADTTIGANLFNVRESNGGGLGQAMFGVGSTGQVTLQNGTNSTTALRLLTDGGTSVLTGDTQNGHIIIGQSSTLNGTLVFNNATNGNRTTITPNAATANRSIALPDDDGTICLDSGNCAGVGGMGDVLQGGNTFGAAFTVGTNDAFDFNLETSGVTRLTVESDGSQVTLASNLDLILQGASAYISNQQGLTNSEFFGSGATFEAGSTGNVTVVGAGSKAGDRSVSVGSLINNTANDSVAIGYGVNITCASAIAIGSGAGACSSAIAIGNGAVASSANSIAIGYSATTTAANQMVIGSNDGTDNHISHVVIGSGVTDSTPNGFVLQGTSGSGSNIAGASVTIAGGQGTGTGNGGDINFQIADPGSSGASLNGLDTVFSLSGTNGAALLQNTINSTQAFRVLTSSGSNHFVVDTTNSRVGIGLGGSNVPNMSSQGLEVSGSIRISGTDADLYTTPGSANIRARLSVVNATLSASNQVIAVGVLSGSDSTSRGITVLDARSGAHQPSIAVLSPDENEISGFSWDGSNSAFLIKNSASSGTIGLNVGGNTKITAGANDVSLASGIDLLLQGASAYISNPQDNFANSEAFGLNASVSGANGSTALGNGAIATGSRSVVLGRSASAAGIDDAVVIGELASVVNSAGMAIGTSATAGFDGIAIGYDTSALFGSSIALGQSATTTANNQFVVGSNNVAYSHVVFGSGVTDATPTGFVLQSTSGSGTNIAGSSVTIAGGQGTGTGNGGGINLQIADPGSTGSSLNSLATVVAISGANGSSTFQNTTDSTAAFQIQNSASAPVFNVDTVNTALAVSSTTAASLYAAKVDYTTATTPYGTTSADFDKDGDMDLAVVNNGSTSVSVFLNTGTGTFAAKVDYTTATNPRQVTAADFDKDGDMDLAVTNSGSTSFSVFMNSGTGTFAAKVDYTTATTPFGIAAGDLDKDGDMDLAVVNNGSTSVSVFLNTGTGTFAAKVDYTTATVPRNVTIADLDKDGDQDLAVTSSGSDRVSVFMNSGTGTFAAKVDYFVGDSPNGIVSADFDKDGDIDLAATNDNASSMSVLLNTGTGTFASEVSYTTGSTSRNLVAADLNKDGLIDLVTTNEGPDTMSIFMNNGKGTFNSKIDFATGTNPNGITSADFNKDGNADLATANGTATSVSVFINSTLAVSPLATPTLSIYTGGVNDALQIKGADDKQLFRVDARGNTTIGNAVDGNSSTLFAAKTIFSPGVVPAYIANADFDKDGDMDMAVTDNAGNTMSILMNDGNGTFGTKVSYTTGAGPGKVVAADFNKDGNVDVVVINNTPTNTASVFINSGTGTFAAKVDYTTGAAPTGIATADLDKDGDIDMVVSNYSADNVSVFMNSGTGTFAAKVDYTTDLGPYDVNLADFDKDGDIDIVAACGDSSEVCILMNSGTGTFAAHVDYAAASVPIGLATADFNKDGAPDLAVADYDGDMSIFLNNGNGTFAARVDYAGGIGSNRVVSADFDKDGDMDVVMSNEITAVSVYLNSGTGTFAAKVDYGISTTGLVDVIDVTAPDLDRDGDADLLVVANDSGFIATLKNNTLSDSAFKVLSGDGIQAFSVDNTNSRVYIGNPTADATGALLVLDTKNTSGDPTGVDGAMYYNSSMGMMRCYYDGMWRMCNEPRSLSWGFDYQEDFISDTSQYTDTGVDVFSLMGVAGWTSGTNAEVYTDDDAAGFDRPGIVALETGTTATGNVQLFDSAFNEMLTLDGGEIFETSVRLNALSVNATQEYDVTAGLCDAAATCATGNGIFFEYDSNSSANWRVRACLSGTCSTTTSSKAVVANEWMLLRLVVNSATSVSFYTKNESDATWTSLGSVTSNIPNDRAEAKSIFFEAIKSVGATERIMWVDYIHFRDSRVTQR